MTRVIVKLSILLFALPGFMYSQEETEMQAKIRIRDMMWKSNDDDFITTQPIEKWKNEPAVFLCKKYEYAVKKEFMSEEIIELTYSHNRILLQDKSAIEKYSTFNFDVSKNIGAYFNYGSKRNVYLGLKVIKPNGKEIIIQINEHLTDNISDRYRNKQVQKVAVPNLQPGDILDYYVASENLIRGSFYYYGFSPVIYPMADEYPIQKQSIKMHIMRKCYLSGRSMNGAPEFKLANGVNSRDVVWEIEDTFREKLKEQDFSYPLREIPYIIFQTFFTNNLMLNNKYFFVDKEDKLKNSLSDWDLKEYFRSIKNDMSYYSLTKKIVKYWKKNCKDETDQAVLAKKAYYFFREYIYGANYQNEIPFNNYYQSSVNDYYFVHILSRALKQKNIPHSLILTSPREIGTVNDIVIRDQMGYLIKVNTEKPFYLSGFDLNSTLSTLEYSYQGNAAKSYQIFLTPNFDTGVTNDTIPVDKASDNVEKQDLFVFFNPDSADKLECIQKVTATGWQKKHLQKIIVSLTDRIKEFEKNRFNLKPQKTPKFSTYQAYLNKLASDTSDRNKRVLDNLKVRYGTENIKLNSCKVIQPGIWDDASDLIFQNQYSITDFISQTGNNYMLSIGELIGNQVEYDKTDSIRLYDIYLSYPKIWNLKICIQLPKGFTIKGIDNLNTYIDNKAGCFISKAVLNGEVLEVTINKQYKTNFLPKTDWAIFKQFIDEANDFRTKKVILVPGIAN